MALPCCFSFAGFLEGMDVIPAGHPSTGDNGPLVWTVGGWVATVWVVSVAADREKEAILCKIEPTLSQASPVPSAKGRMPLGVRKLFGLVGVSWIIWGSEKIPRSGLWTEYNDAGELLISWTGMVPFEGTGEHVEAGKM